MSLHSVFALSYCKTFTTDYPYDHRALQLRLHGLASIQDTAHVEYLKTDLISEATSSSNIALYPSMTL